MKVDICTCRIVQLPWCILEGILTALFVGQLKKQKNCFYEGVDQSSNFLEPSLLPVNFSFFRFLMNSVEKLARPCASWISIYALLRDWNLQYIHFSLLPTSFRYNDDKDDCFYSWNSRRRLCLVRGLENVGLPHPGGLRVDQDKAKTAEEEDEAKKEEVVKENLLPFVLQLVRFQ